MSSKLIKRTLEEAAQVEHAEIDFSDKVDINTQTYKKCAIVQWGIVILSVRFELWMQPLGFKSRYLLQHCLGDSQLCLSKEIHAYGTKLSFYNCSSDRLI